MNRLILKILVILMVVSGTIETVAQQRKVTPVERKQSQLNTAEGKKAAQQLIEQNVRPSMIYSDSIINVEEFTRRDTSKKVGNVYPRLYSLAFGVNIWDPMMRIFGQKYGLVDVSAELSFHNRYQAILELGLGNANSTPDDMNYTYKSPLSFYGKLGGSYNITYNSNPAYRFTFGALIGYSAFKYSIEDVSVSSGYWQQQGKFNIDNINSHALWAELTFGLRVQIWRRIFMGWNLRYKFMMNYKKSIHGSPWYVPGMGVRTQAVSGAFSIYYVLPLDKKNGLSKAEKTAEEYPTYIPPDNPENSIPLNP